MVWFRREVSREISALPESIRAGKVDEWKWLSGSTPHKLNDLDQSDLDAVNSLADFHSRVLHQPEVSTFIFTKARRLYDYIRYTHSTSPEVSKPNRVLVNSILAKLESICAREVEHPKVVERLTVSTPHMARFLHRTSKDSARSIVRNGLRRAGYLTGTATLQPRDVPGAVNSYHETHLGSNAVVVLEIPRKIWLEAHPRTGGGVETLHPAIGTAEHGGTVNPVHVIGFFDRTNGDKFTLNPRYSGFRV